MKFKKEVTIYDLAKELNYSPSTISRALNNHKSISKKTIKIIKEAAEQMGYRPNHLAAGLRNNKSNTIGILISRINRPFISSLISGIEETARKAGYNVLISQSNDNYENEISNSNALYDSRITGLIVSLSMETVNMEHFQKFVDKGIPLVFVDRVPDSFNSYKVVIDNYTAGYSATKHLIEQGCTRIAHFAGAQHRNIYAERKKGYLDALKEYGLPLEDELIVYFKSLSFEEGTKATKKLLDMPNPPDGIFSANDTAAVSVIMCAKKMGVDVPNELAVIGFNDDPISSIVQPPLSTVTHPASKMGAISARRIINHSAQNYDADLSEVTVLGTEVIVRESSIKK
ncbi:MULTISPECIES: LacI family DNA-binding transcriptional regulator [Flavobacteriaceae]|uniref:LacI family DNA-binding transcriptional regulator n=1 Tax=Flavobacteriaceae TaxID=49546 RepID=UPI001491D803|nr:MULTISPECIES: LacI family DNA-binding transcriptional regulator [Allomuricauda]MDC6366192.1 LacI family DNA-binding transcriptional regulator [Muricauda sp. AC10]